jgi:hypothetical protein
MHHSLSHPISSAYTKEEELIEKNRIQSAMHAESLSNRTEKTSRNSRRERYTHLALTGLLTFECSASVVYLLMPRRFQTLLSPRFRLAGEIHRALKK